jgi:hypothetical protein
MRDGPCNRAAQSRLECPAPVDNPRQVEHVLYLAERRRSDLEPSGESEPPGLLSQLSLQTGCDPLEGQL